MNPWRDLVTKVGSHNTSMDLEIFKVAPRLTSVIRENQRENGRYNGNYYNMWGYYRGYSLNS